LQRAIGRRDGPNVIEVRVGAMPSPWEFIFMDKIRGG
jgi:acetolactate synthase-1/2/3 large subunit